MEMKVQWGRNNSTAGGMFAWHKRTQVGVPKSHMVPKIPEHLQDRQDSLTCGIASNTAREPHTAKGDNLDC